MATAFKKLEKHIAEKVGMDIGDIRKMLPEDLRKFCENQSGEPSGVLQLTNK